MHAEIDLPIGSYAFVLKCLTRERALCFALCMLFGALPIQSQGYQTYANCFDVSYTNQLPKDLFSTRSAGVVYTADTGRLDWHAFSQRAQSYFQKIGLDMISYAASADVFMNHNMLQAYGMQWRSRAVKYLIFLDVETSDKQQENQKILCTIVPLAKQRGLLSAQSVGWQHTASSLKRLYEHIEQLKTIRRMEQENWLVNEVAEFSTLPLLTQKKQVKKLPHAVKKLYLGVSASCLRCDTLHVCSTKMVENQQIRTWFETNYKGTYKFRPIRQVLPPSYEYVLHLLHGFRPSLDVLLQEKSRTYTPEETVEKVYAFYIKHTGTGIIYSLSHRGKTISEALAPLGH